MTEMTLRATECDACEEHKLCWRILTADVCAECLDTASNVIRAVEDFGFIDAGPRAVKSRDARRGQVKP